VPTPDVPESRNAPKRAGLTPKVVIATITILAGLIGAIKTITSETTGSTLPVGHLLFYIGGSAFALYIACAAAIAAGGAVMFLASTGDAEESEPATYLAFAAGAVAAVLVLIALANAGVLWDYDGLDQFGRISVAVVGLGVLALPVYLYARGRDE